MDEFVRRNYIKKVSIEAGIYGYADALPITGDIYYQDEKNFGVIKNEFYIHRIKGQSDKPKFLTLPETQKLINLDLAFLRAYCAKRLLLTEHYVRSADKITVYAEEGNTTSGEHRKVRLEIIIKGVFVNPVPLSRP